MGLSGLRNARDYNRGLAAPIRWGHMAWALVQPVVSPVWRWASDPVRRDWAPPLLIGLVLVLLLLPLDGPIARFARAHPLGGDLRRELEALQQYGQGLSSLLIAAVIWIQDPARRRRLADWAAAFGSAFVVVFLIKTMLGRPRPKYDDPWIFLGPTGQYPVDGAGVRHAWELWGGISSDLWSMPSSHTAYAFVMAVFIAAVYPRLRGLVFAIACIVGLGRILTGAHFPSDVAAGWAIGMAVARTVVHRRWGERALDRWTVRHHPPVPRAEPPAEASPQTASAAAAR